MNWTTACPDWEARIVAGKSLVPCAPLYPAEAQAALDVFKSLRIVDLPGRPTFGEACRPWVFDFVAAIFGAYDAEAGRRLITEFFLLISKKNGKSTLAAGIMLTALLRNWRDSNEAIILAPTIEIANNSAEPAMDMVRADEELSRILKCTPHERTIEHRTTKATLKIVAADSETVGGKKAAFVLIDELWLFGKKMRAANMLREAVGGLASRKEGFVIALSTASDEPPAGVFKSWLDRYRDIRDGKLIAPRSLGVLYEFPKSYLVNDTFRDPVNWYITNPSLNAGVDEQFLLDELDKATHDGAKAVAGFFAKHLNVEIGVNLRAARWPGADFWARRADPDITLDEILARCETVVVGLDGGGLDDLFGLCVLGRESVETEIEVVIREDGAERAVTGALIEPQTKPIRFKRWLAWCHAWCHRGVLTRRQSIATALEGFEKDGDLTIVDDELDDIAQIVAVIEQVKDAGLLYCVAVDPAGLGALIDELAKVDITQDNKEHGRNFVIGVGQGYAMMNALKTAERKLANGSLVHSEQPLMDWAIGNLKIEPTATAIRATKQNAGDAKVDPAFALFDAVTIMSTNPDCQMSAYADRGILFA